MEKRYYHDYVFYMLSRIMRKTSIRTQIDAWNAECCSRVILKSPKWEAKVIQYIFEQPVEISLETRVGGAAERYRATQDMIWVIVDKMTKRIAQERGLIA